MSILKIIGNNVSRMRQENGWSQEELGFNSGLHRTYISGIERGTRNPTIGVLYQLSQAFGIELTELIMMLDNETSQTIE